VKWSAAIILSLLLLSNSLHVSFIYGWYALDIDSFIEQLCENKDRPQLQCNGKCALARASQASSKSESSTPPMLKWEQLVYCNLKYSEAEYTSTPVIDNKGFLYISLKAKEYTFSIFHPPKYS